MSAIDLAKAAANRASLKSRPQQREAATAKAEQTAQAKSRFEEDFNLVDEHFGLDASGEREQALEAAKNDPAGARICYAAIAASLRRENPAIGLTDRIRARIIADAKAAA